MAYNSLKMMYLRYNTQQHMSCSAFIFVTQNRSTYIMKQTCIIHATCLFHDVDLSVSLDVVLHGVIYQRNFIISKMKATG